MDYWNEMLIFVFRIQIILQINIYSLDVNYDIKKILINYT